MNHLRCVLVLAAVLTAAILFPVIPAQAQGSSQLPVAAHCCVAAEEPGLPGQQYCTEGHDCCAGGQWQCNDATGTTSCDPPCGPNCCDPGDEPVCVEGATCCGNGVWQCNDPGGFSTCSSAGAACQIQCCDPGEEPGQFGNPFCIEGATCCGNGQWQCNDAGAQSTCRIDSFTCAGCCDPLDQPGQDGTPGCIEGSTCCADGDWQCNNGAGQSSCNVDGLVCDNCCNPFEEPGQFGNPFCIEGATCCSSGEWQCNDGTGQSSCALDGDVCQPQCCDPFEEPGQFGNPICFEGATCCADGSWQCNDAGGGSTCQDDGFACERCCDPTEEPGQFGNPFCFEGASCCANGKWQCNDAGAESTCLVDGLSCEGCCDASQEPPCIEGATCCSDGSWACNNGAGESTCTLDGDTCDSACCDPIHRPNTGTEPFCDSGFTCCADGSWKCNDPTGASTCPNNQLGDECQEICGGIAGIECNDPGDFCKLPTGDCCCDAFGVCTEIPQACPEFLDPVCGCDGVTYDNECFADAAGASIEHYGPCGICGGIAGIPCDDGEYCQFAPGECCCDFFGMCQPIPEACPAACDPVCGCDGTTYANPCQAAMAGVSIEHDGPCTSGGGLIEGVEFESRAKMAWKAHPQALFYSVYRAKVTQPPQLNAGTCFATGLLDPQVAVNGAPVSGVVWNFQVTGHFDDGEGSMGFGSSSCQERKPVTPCDPGEEFLCEITGGDWDPLSCGHYPCGQFPACDAIIPGCDCGAGNNFVSGVGCRADPGCNQ